MLVQKAQDFAIERHKGQFYAEGDYFEKHVQGVADSVNKALSEKQGVGWVTFQETLAVAYLHDTVEDSDATIDDIKTMFGNNIAEAVDAMTHREGEEYQVYITRTLKNDMARVVKYHDIMFNLNQTMVDSIHTNIGKRRVAKYMKALKQFSDYL